MILFTNGCSWTWGGALEPYFQTEEERLQLVWPHHLGNLMNAERVVNLAHGCGSNQRIFRTTFDWIQKTPQEELDRTIAVIQWTEYSRYEYYNRFYEMKDPYENYNDCWARAKVDIVANCEKDIINPEKIDLERALKRNHSRLETYTQIEGIYKHLQECIALASLFKQYNIKYFYWEFGYYATKAPAMYKDYLLNNFNYIIDMFDYERFSDDPHPSLLGHKQIAQGLLANMKI